MTDRGFAPSAEAYSPQRRTALVLTGTGTAGAYHAGALRALHEAGVKLDIVAGRGVGAIGALFAAIDGAQRLWDQKGFWRSPAVRHFYPWHSMLRFIAVALGVSLAVLTVPIAAVVSGLIVFPIDFVLKMVGIARAGGLTAWYLRVADAAFAPEALPTWLPRLVLLVLGAATVAAAAGVRRRQSRRLRGGSWWRLVPGPILTEPIAAHVWSVLWDLVRGATQLKQPARVDLARRYTEMLTENLGQPGFRELLIVAHDVDAGRDLVFALVAESRRRGLIRRPTTEAAESRQAEVLELSGVSRDHLTDAVAAALTIPVASDFHRIRFMPESYWRGEEHRVSDRPGSLERIIDELITLDVEQVVLVSAAPESSGPHALAAPRADGPGRIGEYLCSSEAALVRDVTARSRQNGPRIFVVRPTHNPVGPFDFAGGFDDRSARTESLVELMSQGYEDAYRQFVEPVVGASGDMMSRGEAVEGR